MAETPIPLETAQERSQLNAQLDKLNAAGDYEFQQLGGVDAKLAIHGRLADLDAAQIQAAADSDAAPQEPARLGDLVAQYDAPLTGLGQRLVPDLERALPVEVHGVLSQAVRIDLPRIVAEVTAASAAPRLEETEATLRQEWRHEYDERIRYADCAWDHLPDSARAQINRSGIRLHPDMLRMLSKIGARILGADGSPMTEHGYRWTLARGAEDHEDREREKAEQAERDRALDERFRYGR